jgi:hypothetical protein
LGVSVFVVVWVVSLLITMPANFVWQRLPEINQHLARIGLSVVDMEGTVWRGKALLRYQTLHGLLSWDVHVLSMLRMRLPVDVHLKSDAGEAALLLELTRTGQRLQIPRAELELARLSPLLKPQRVTLDGQLLVLDVEFMFTRQVVDYVAGQLSWSGGKIGYPAGRQVRERTMPPFEGLLSMQEDQAHFGLREAGGRFDLVEATLNRDGEAMARVKGRLFELAQEPLPGNYGEQDSVFKVKQKILPLE